MTLQLYGHPFSSYTMKALIPLYENGTAFEFRMLSPDHPENNAMFAELAPVGRFPVLVDGDTVVHESSAIIEHCDLRHPGPVAMIPVAAEAAVQARMLDRLFDNYVMTPMQVPVFDAVRPADADRDPWGVAQARDMLDKAYGWLDTLLTGRVWAIGEEFSIADCAAAPSLFYADWVRPIPERHATLRAYRARLLARPSVARCIDEARPYRAFFPLGAPDRD
jgi:glutathione S-transferase